MALVYDRINEDVMADSRRSVGTADIPAPEGLSYIPYQVAGIEYASERNTLIGDEMGLGKTIQALGTINNLGSDRVLVIAPPSLLKNWEREADKWLVEDPPTHIIKDGKPSSWTMPDDGPGVAIIGYSNLAKHRHNLRASDWDMVIQDEGHYIGNLGAQRTPEVVGCVADACKTPGLPDNAGLSPIAADRKLILTGTPYDAKTAELWPLITYLAPQHWGSSSDSAAQQKFRQRFYDARNRRGRNLGQLQRELRSTVMLRRTGDDVNDQVQLGPLERRTIILEAGSEEERLAVKRSGDLNVSPMDADIARPENAPKFTEISRILGEAALAKAPQVGRYVAEAAQEEPSVFFAYHRGLFHAVSDELDRAGIKHDVIDGGVPAAERAKMVQRFQDGRTQAILLSQGTGKEGFTLTRSRRAIFGDLSWRPTDLLQAEKRIHRIGQDKDVLAEYLVLDQSLDAMQADVMARKMQAIAGGLGVSETAEEFCGPECETDDDLYLPPLRPSEAQQRMEFCKNAPHTPESRAQVERWVESDVKESLKNCDRRRSPPGFPTRGGAG